MSLAAEELLAGGALRFDVEIPDHVLHPRGAVAERVAASGADPSDPLAETSDGAVDRVGDAPARVRLRPLTIADLQVVTRAAAEHDTLLATLMVQRALVEPELAVTQVAQLHAGLVHWLLDEVNRISGITASSSALASAAEAPIARAAFLLAREYGWSPQEVNDLTLGQVLLHLELLEQGTGP